MISLYTGTPGSGKSLDVARLVMSRLRHGFNVIGTMYINQDMIKKKKYKGKYIFVDIFALQPKDLIAYARKYHEKGKEGQCLLVIDECQRIFNSRDWQAIDRRAWNDFFQVHRHFGFNIILITQYDRLIDRQLRALVEYQHIHRKVSNFGIRGMLVSLFVGGGLFISVVEWYPVHQKTDTVFFKYHRKYSRFYDSYMAFEENSALELNELLPYIQEEEALHPHESLEQEEDAAAANGDEGVPMSGAAAFSEKEHVPDAV